MEVKKVLVHICCGICSSSVVESLGAEEFKVIGYFYNPNIYPFEEYQKRLQIAQEVAKILEFELIEGEYEAENWFTLTADFKNEPEGGKRCEICFKIRLSKVYEKTKKLKLPFFTTTLTVSPHKNTQVINRIGEELSKNNFLVRDFKKKDGFKKTLDFAKRFNLYRQHYCGCLYSLDSCRRTEKHLTLLPH